MIDMQDLLILDTPPPNSTFRVEQTSVLRPLDALREYAFLYIPPSLLLSSIGNHTDLLQIQRLLKQKIDLSNQPHPRIHLHSQLPNRENEQTFIIKNP
jgi:hypothetical protein